MAMLGNFLGNLKVYSHFETGAEVKLWNNQPLGWGKLSRLQQNSRRNCIYL